MNKFLTLILIFIFFINSGFNREENALLKKTKQAVSEEQKILTLIDLTNFYEHNNYTNWQNGIKQLDAYFTKIKSKKIKNKIALSLASYSVSLGNFDKSKSYFNTINTRLSPLDAADIWKYNFLKIKFLVYENDLKNAKKIAFQFLQEIKQKRKNRYISEYYSSLATIYALENNRDSAYICARYSTSFGKRSDTKQRLFQALHQQAQIFAHFENFEDAVNKELQVLQMAELDNNLYYQVLAFQGVSFYCLEIKNIDEAIIYLSRAKDLNSKLRDKRINANSILIESGIYINKRKFKDALKSIKLIETYFETNNDYFNLGNSAFLKGVINLKFKNYKQSIEAFEKAIILFKLSGNLVNISLVNQFMGEVYLIKKDFTKAENLLKLTLAENEKRGFQSIKIQSVYKLLSQLYFKKNQLQLAIKYQQLNLKYYERNMVSSASSNVARMTEGNLREERERLIEFQKESIEKQTKERQIKGLKQSRQFFIFGIIIGLVVFVFIFYILQLRQEKLKQKQREMELSQSLLRSQMNPHFIFNAMSVIQSYIYSNEPDKSSQFLVNFSRLIRLILENSPKEFIPIELEIEILEKYLQAQKMRFENRFSYFINIDESLFVDGVMVPPMITQPFVENAIEHGQLHTIKEGQINIDIREKNSMIYIQISDNGVGRKGAKKNNKIKTHKSMAIDITRERIEIINFKYKKQGSINIEDNDKENQTGTIVSVILPILTNKL